MTLNRMEMQSNAKKCETERKISYQSQTKETPIPHVHTPASVHERWKLLRIEFAEHSSHDVGVTHLAQSVMVEHVAGAERVRWRWTKEIENNKSQSHSSCADNSKPNERASSQPRTASSRRKCKANLTRLARVRIAVCTCQAISRVALLSDCLENKSEDTRS